MSPPETDPAASPARGRPRDPAVDEALLTATSSLLAEVGYDALTVDAVATRAGVGKATVYRRHANKQELVLAALRGSGPTWPEGIDTGDARQDLYEITHLLASVARQDMAVLALTITRRATEPALVQLVQRGYVEPRRAVARAAIERGQGRGQLRDDVSARTMIDCLVGVLGRRRMVLGDGPVVPDELATAVLDDLWPMLRAPGATP